jgi:hypothetical protein
MELKLQNPLAAITHNTTGQIDPSLDIYTSDHSNSAVSFGVTAGTGEWCGDAPGSSKMCKMTLDLIKLYQPSDPMAVLWLGTSSSGARAFKLLHHGDDRKLWEYLWDNGTTGVQAVKFAS